MKRKILIIDDDPGIQDILKIIFNKAGYEVNIEPNGQAILDNEYEHPDIILLDRQLSGFDGLDICRELKENPRSRNIPVIMISASPDISSMAVKAGADGYMEKPFNIKDLLRLIDGFFITQM